MFLVEAVKDLGGLAEVGCLTGLKKVLGHRRLHDDQFLVCSKIVFKGSYERSKPISRNLQLFGNPEIMLKI